MLIAEASTDTGGLVTWWYEIRDSENQVVEMRRGFLTQAEAQEVGERTRRTILDISLGRVLTLVTGEDIWRPE